MASSSAWKENPYIIGRPIYEPELFFGREQLFDFIKDNLNKSAKVILLHGQRRIGKSSVLDQIPNFVRLEKFVFVPLSLEGKSQKQLSEVLHDLATDIFEHLELSKDQVTLPSKFALEEEPQVFADKFLSQVYQALNGKNLVLLLDEFDVLGDYSGDTAVAHFFPYLQSVVYQQKELFIIPVVGRRLDDMPILLSLFREAPNREIGLLGRRSAEQLITKPAEGVLEYEPDAIDAILELTAGHPYFTQVLCFALFEQARDEQNWQIARPEVERIVNQAIEIGEGGLAWFRDGLPIPERVVFSAIAEFQQQKLDSSPEDSTSRFGVVEGEPLTLLQKFGVVLTELLRRAEERLIEWGFLQQLGTVGNSLPLKLHSYKVTVELVRRWLVKRYPLRREIWELENLNSEAQRIYEEAAAQSQRGTTLNAIALYEQVLAVNPNHFSALFALAEEYLDVEDFSKAVELYKRVYQVDSVRSQEDYIKVLLSYGRNFLFEGNFELAKEQFTQASLLQAEKVELRILVDYLQPETLLQRITSLLSVLHQAIGLTDEQEDIIKAQAKAWEAYHAKLNSYRQALLEATYKEYPLTANTRRKLHSLHRGLGLADKDVEIIMQRFAPKLKASVEESKKLYRQEVERFANDGNISPIGHRILDVRREELRLTPEEAEVIEQEVLKPYRTLEEYQKAFIEAVKYKYPFSEDMWNELKELQRILGITDEDAAKIEKQFMSEEQMKIYQKIRKIGNKD